MDTCFLFTKDLDSTGCVSLKLSQNGEVISPPLRRGFDEIRALQANCINVIVETSENAGFFELELPWLADRKARAAIPYALEDKVAQAVDQLHFAFDKLRYQNNRYLITVISKQRLSFIMQVLDEHAINYETITTDWFALSPHELVVSDSVLLINQETFKGTLKGDLALTYLKSHSLYPPLLFQDSQIKLDANLPIQAEHSTVWLAQRLLKNKPLNLCQGEKEHGTHSDWIKKGYQVAGILAGFWLLSLLLINTISLFSLNKKTAKVDEQIAVIYHQFFPNAKQVISPKFRINQLLGSTSSDAQIHFWFLLNQFAKVMKDKSLNLEQLRYQNNTLFVTINGPDFASLEQIETQLKQAQIKVRQTQASTLKQHVVATLELT